MKQKLLAMMFALFAVQATVWAEETSGYCGDPRMNVGKDVAWTFVEGTLTISGTGKMANFEGRAPWGENIKEAFITEGVTNIGDNAFCHCRGLTSVTIPNSVTSIGDDAFNDCTSLTSITIPNSVTSIGDNAFCGCTSLTNITLPNSVTSIGNGAFHDCTSLTSITIPNSVTVIGSHAFSGCTNLTIVTIPNSVKYIGSSAFEVCTGLTCITIPSSVTYIGDSAFGYASGLTSIVVDVDNSEYDSRDNCNAIIHTETNKLISGCQNTVIPNSVTSIGDNAFYNCTGLTSITIPNSVTSIGDKAFLYCTNLTNVTCLSPVPPTLDDRVFYYYINLKVPAESVEAYKASDWAQYFSSIEPLDVESISEVEADRNDAPIIIHDLSGRRVTNPVKGQIYIVNGKAVVM